MPHGSLNVDAYFEAVKRAFSREASYRGEAFTALGSLVLRVYLLRQLWTALYAQNAAPINLPLHSMLTYATVALLMSLVLEIDGTRAIRERIRDGSIAMDFMKPIVVPFFYFADGVGQTLFAATMVLPALGIALSFVHIDIAPPATLAAFALAFLFGYAINFLLNFLMNAVAFWTLETFAVQLMVRWVSDILSGQIIPLTFFPALLGRIVFALPFSAIYSTPLLIYVGIIPVRAWPAAFAVQAAWLAILALASWAVWQAASRRVVVQGG